MLTRNTATTGNKMNNTITIDTCRNGELSDSATYEAITGRSYYADSNLNERAHHNTPDYNFSVARWDVARDALALIDALQTIALSQINSWNWEVFVKSI